MKRKRYRMSYTTGTLLHHESVELVQLYIQLVSWENVRERVVTENLLQSRTLNTLKRVCNEIIGRLKMLHYEELHLLASGTQQEQSYILWIAICRRYRFIWEFAVEVIREKYVSLKYNLDAKDYDAFFNKKAEWYPELDHISPVTRNKFRQMLFRTLREVHLLDDNYTIDPAMLSSRLVTLVSRIQPEDLLCFPVLESDLTRRDL